VGSTNLKKEAAAVARVGLLRQKTTTEKLMENIFALKISLCNITI
jgi:hypothetical protein